MSLYSASFEVKFMKRQANIVAHTFTRATICLSNNFKLLSPYIEHLLYNKIN
jgi:hypothetical protein